MTNDGYNGMVVGAFDGLPAEVKNNAIETATKIHRHLNKSAEEIINAGLEFIRMKEDLKGTRGAFGEWLEMYLPDLGQRAATKFMNVARKFGEGENGEFAVLKPSILYLLSAPGTAATDSEIESIIEANPPTAKAAQAELDELRGEVDQKVEVARAEGIEQGKHEALSDDDILCAAKVIRSERSEEKTRVLEKKKADNKLLSTQDIHNNPPIIHNQSYKQFLADIPDKSADVLITDPPFSTDIDDISGFAADWLPLALSKVNTRAYICIGAYPKEMKAYLEVLLNQSDFILDNPLIWTYRNTLGVTPKSKYNLNYQVILHLYKEGSELDVSITNEMFSVQDISAPDGRQGDRFHTWQKPDELANRLIRHSTNPGDVVIDPFSCTGAFLIAAARHGCAATGCDIDPGAVEIAASRGCQRGA